MNDINGLTDSFKKNMFNKLDLQNIKIEVNYDELSSLEMELNSKTSIKLTPEQLTGEKTKTKKIEDIVIEEDDEDDSFKAENVKLVLEGALILDPIGGMHIEGLIVKDSINIKITDNNHRAIHQTL